MGKAERSDFLREHEAEGRYFEFQGVKTFRLDKGSGIPVLCLHGVPTSSYLYRKLIRSLEDKGYRGICIDLPGLGLTDRPENFDYSFENFANFLAGATEILNISQFHLVVHDIGGPIGFALAAQNRKRVLSLSILDTWIDVVNYEKPLVMKPFENRVLGETELKAMNSFTWPLMFKGMGILDPDSVPEEEMNVYLDLLKREDGGKAFLKIMRNFTSSKEFRKLCYSAVQAPPYPMQLIWGEKDVALSFERYGEEIKKVAGLKTASLLPARHFLQEEVWMGIAEKIDEIILSTQAR